MSLKDDAEKLAVWQALYQIAGKAVGTKSRDNLRADVSDGLRELYESTGAKSVDIKVNGQKVGTMSLRVAKAEERMELICQDERAFIAWLCGDGSDYLTEAVRDGMGRKVLEYAVRDGVVPDGCQAVRDSIPETIVGTTLRVDPEKVWSAGGQRLGEYVRGALEGGDEQWESE
jgi:hypothetical protein